MSYFNKVYDVYPSARYLTYNTFDDDIAQLVVNAIPLMYSVAHE